MSLTSQSCACLDLGGVGSPAYGMVLLRVDVSTHFSWHIKTIPLRHPQKPPISKQSCTAVPRDLSPRCGEYIGLYGWENGLFWNNIVEMTSAMEDEDDAQVSHVVKEV